MRELTRLLAAVVCVLALQVTASADVLSDAMAGVEKRFELLRDVRVEYDLHESYPAPPGPRTRVGKMTMQTIRQSDGTIVTKKYAPSEATTVMTSFLVGEVTKQCVWRRLNDCIRLEMSDDGTAPQQLRVDHAIQSAYGNRVDLLTSQVTIERQDGKEVWKRTPSWGIVPRDGDPMAQIDVALGLRFDHDDDRLLTLADLRGLEVVRCDEESLVLSRLDRNGLHLFHFNASYGWALDRYEMFQKGLPAAEWRCEDFREVSGVWMPHLVKMRFKCPLVGPEFPGKSLEITVKKVEFAPNDGGEASFPLVFPNGATVCDLRSGLPFKIESGDQILTDEKIDARVEAYRRFEKDARDRVSKGWKPTEAELNALMAEHFKDLKR
jgi:hypothetical protein